MSVWLGKLTPAVQTRVVRGVQLALEVHLKSREDQVSVYAAALTYNGFLSILPLALVGLSIAGFMVGSIAAIFGILIFLRLAMWLFLYGAEISSILRDQIRWRSGQVHLRRHGLEPGDAHREELVER